MQHFLCRFLTGICAFAVANVASFFARSDDLFTPDLPDAMTRFGFPFLVYQDGGPAALCWSNHSALLGDILVAAFVSLAAAALWPAISRDILQTLGIKRPTSGQLGLANARPMICHPNRTWDNS